MWPFQSQRLLSEEKRKEEISRLSVELQSKADQLGSKVEELDKLRSENSKLENRNHDLVLTVNNLKICQGQNQDLVLQKSQLENDLKTSQEETTKEIPTGKEEDTKGGQMMKTEVQSK